MPDRGRLPCPVRTQKTIGFALFDFETDSEDAAFEPIILGQVFDFNYTHMTSSLFCMHIVYKQLF